MQPLLCSLLFSGALAFSSVKTPTASTPQPTSSVDNGKSDDISSAVWKDVATCRPTERSHEELTFLVPEHGGEARVPEGLDGTYYVNGLASCQVGSIDGEGSRFVHPFESHGFLKSFSFDSENNKVVLEQAKYVKTPVRAWEERLQRPLFRGSMSSVADRTTLVGRLQNALSPTKRETANLAVRKWGHNANNNKNEADDSYLLATADNCAFYQMDPETLETIGPALFQDDALQGKQMLAHTRVDKNLDRLVSCSLEYDVMNQATILTFFEIDSSGHVVSKRTHTQSPAIVMHDWVMTPNYYVVPAAQAVFDLAALPNMITGGSAATDIFSVNSKSPGTILLIPRNSIDKPVVQAELADGRHGVVFHSGPTFENANNDKGNMDASEVVLYPFVFDRYQFGGEMGFLDQEQRFDPVPWSNSNGGPKLEEWRIPLPPSSSATRNNASDNTIVVAMQSKRLNNKVISDMPTFHPDRDGGDCPTKYVYSLAGIRPQGWFPFNAVCKHDLTNANRDAQIWPPEAARFIENGGDTDWNGGDCVRSEPLFVPRQRATNDESPQDDDDGYLLSTTHDTSQRETSLDVYDARKVQDGPILRINVGELWGWNVHSSFVPRERERQE